MSGTRPAERAVTSQQSAALTVCISAVISDVAKETKGLYYCVASHSVCLLPYSVSHSVTR
eukprot:6196337-Pleurochrysis_carterae.AAC.2